MQERSDEQLMAAVMTGDQVALAALVTRHHGPLLGYLYRLLSAGDGRAGNSCLTYASFLTVQPHFPVGWPQPEKKEWLGPALNAP
ncbi:MAG TPA: hypothetical protein VF458_13040 [Ktedonobacteraceae bacterium]